MPDLKVECVLIDVMGYLCHGSCLFCLENFAKSEYYRLAVEQLNDHSPAMANLGAPPLKIHNIHLTDRYNRIDHNIAQVSQFFGVE